MSMSTATFEGEAAHGVAMKFEVLAEIDATGFFEDESVNWRYCMEHATFSHKEACEFIIHAGDADYMANTAERMRAFGCDAAFIDAYRRAAEAGAVRVLFHIG